MMRLALLALLVAASCKRGAEPKAEVSEETRPGPERGSAGGFSASLSADLEVRGPTKPAGSNDFFSEGSGSGSETADKAGSADPKSGSADTKVATNDTKPATGSAAPQPATGSADAKPESKPATGSATDPKAGSAAKPVEKPEIDMTPVTPPKPPVAMTPELKAIKLSLLPNWKRDVAEPATISLDVEVQSKDVKETFKFSYGYEDPKAPTDREAFKKYLADAKILTVITDRQRGAAWYLEGNDGRGQTAFRLIVTWGGKRLYCGGSSYKQNDLGDIRDEVVVQAKKICETVAL